MHWANTVGMLSNLTPTSLGFFNDSMRLLRRFVQEEDDGFETFRKLYIDMCFPSIDIATKSCPSQLKQLYFEMFSVVVIYCFPPAILKRRIGAVYLLYSLYFQQPRDERVYIRLIVDQFVEFSKFRVSLVKDGYREAAYCLYQLFRKQAFYITAYSNECNPYLTLCELYRNEMRKISDLYTKEVIHEELAHSTEAKTLDVIHKYYVDVRNRLLESLPKNDRLKFTPKINAGTEDILGIAPLPSIKDAKLKALKRTHKVVEDYVVDDEIGEHDNEGDECDYDLPSTSTSCTKYQKKSEARKNVKASSQNRRNKANYTSSSTSADDSAFEGVNWELVKYLDVRRFVFFSKDAGGGWFFSFFFPFPMLNHCNLPSSSSIQVDTSLAVDSSENQVDEEDVLLGSALEKTLLQLNSANTGPADDGHSSLTVDQSMDEQSDSGIRNRLRPRPRANVNSLGKLSKAMLFEKATNAWHRYLEILTRHPLKTQMLITGFLMGAGDVSSQIFIETKKKPKRFDFVRTARFICIGSFFFAPLLKSWFAFLQNRIHCKAFPRLSPVKRLFADQIICSPVILASFLVLLRTLEMKPIKTAFHQCRTQFWDIYLTGLRVWPLMQLVNFYLVPLEHRILVVQMVAIFWNTYLAWKTQSDEQLLTDH
ncbi:Mpv17-like protein [Trichinella nativa]|uniref:Mitochondrial inner membrane protein Mpv17 n=2 Tax=Trichinella nativa TaxID=6335 RepID=A0A0V1LBE9_9BILA|nr:Mpv17-like protein [Trichinella nativa]